MLTIALATSGDLCSLAIRDDAGTLVSRAFRHRMRLSERLMQDAAELLAGSGIALRDIDAIGVDVGPGSFTGVRIGVMTAKTWADALGKPIAGISALEAVAADQALVDGLTVLPVIRARPGTVYAQPFEWNDGCLQAGSDPALIEPAAVVTLVTCDACVLCGDGISRLGAEIAAALRASGKSVILGSAVPPRAETVARLAEARILAGRADDAIALSPMYLAPPPIDPRAERSVPS